MASQSDYLLNEDELNKLVDDKKTVYIYDWLRRLSKLLLVTQKVNYKFKNCLLIDDYQLFIGGYSRYTENISGSAYETNE